MVAPRERLAREAGRTRTVSLGEELAAIRHRCAALPVLDTRTGDAVIGYDRHGSYLEVAHVIEARFGESGGRELDLWLHRAGVDLVAVDADQAEVARSADRQFGKGRHRAGLNFCDCFAYALARVSGEPVLVKGDDFGHTDVDVVGTTGP